MYKNKKIVCVIPARLASTRFPRKMLATLCQRPLLEWVWKAATSVPYFDEVVFAVDAQETANVIAQFGGKSVMTSVDCAVGTDRLVELALRNEFQADVWVNWQGDEPFIIKRMIEQLLATCDDGQGAVWTLKKVITNVDDVASPMFAKVVCDVNGNALYFSRLPIPYFRDERDMTKLVQARHYFKHVGLYAFTTDALKSIATMPYNPLEDAEKLEMIRWLANGLKVQVHETDYEVFGIDTPADLDRATQRINALI